MSRGLGKIERGLVAAMGERADNALTARELCERIFGSALEKKHRVSVLRAMRSLADGSANFGLIGRPGVGMALYTRNSEASFRMAQAKLVGQRRFCRGAWWQDEDLPPNPQQDPGTVPRAKRRYYYEPLSTAELEKALLADPEEVQLLSDKFRSHG